MVPFTRKRPIQSSQGRYVKRQRTKGPSTVQILNEMARKAAASRRIKANQMQVSSITKNGNRRKRITKTTGNSAEYGGKFSRKRRANTFSKYTKSGAVVSREVGSAITTTVNTYPVYVGHATHAHTAQITKLFFMCLVRNLFEKAGIEFISYEAIDAGAYVVAVSYTLFNEGAAKAEFTTTTINKSFETIAADLESQWITLWTTSGNKNSFMHTAELRYSTGATGANVAYIDLRGISVEVYAKSDLKVQNRTLASGADEDNNSTSNVGNQPLYGKSYSGKGTGMMTKFESAGNVTQLNVSTGTNFAGSLAYSPAAGEGKYFGEPPLPTLFSPKPKFSNASLLPGQIKTSSLTAKMVIRQKELWNTLLYTDGGLGVAQKGTDQYGKYHIMALEKTMCVSATDTSPFIGYELNQRMGIKFNKLRRQHVSEIFTGQVFA